MKIFKLFLTIILLIACSGAMYQYIGTKLDEQKYPPIGRMIDIDGYKLHMIDSGQNNGNLTVIIVAGAGSSSLDWQLVQPEIAKFTRVISYDRAGHGWSQASPLPRTSKNIVTELHTMLHNANIPGPYILVGHSFGGFNVRLFATMYSDEVAGVVLVDALNEKDFQPRTVTLYEQVCAYTERFKKIMATYFGITRIMSKFGIDDVHKDLQIYPTFHTNHASFQQAYFAKKLTPQFIAADIDERSSFTKSAEQLRQAGGLLGDTPLTVITAGKPWPGKENDDLNAVWPELQADLVTKSSRGKQIIAEHSDHMVNLEQPEIIIATVREMVDELKNN